ncbi:MAG: hypothetical protein ACRD4B_09775, partial [Acidobacteriota bacterium]
MLPGSGLSGPGRLLNESLTGSSFLPDVRTSNSVVDTGAAAKNGKFRPRRLITMNPATAATTTVAITAGSINVERS